MRNGLPLWTVFFLCLLLPGCAVKKKFGPSAVIPQNCLTGPLILTGCDWRVDPPQCSKAKIPMRKGCAEIKP